MFIPECIPIFIEIDIYLTNREHKITWHVFLRHGVIRGNIAKNCVQLQSGGSNVLNVYYIKQQVPYYRGTVLVTDLVKIATNKWFYPLTQSD